MTRGREVEWRRGHRGGSGEWASPRGRATVRYGRVLHFEGEWGESLVSRTLLAHLPEGWVVFDDWASPGGADNTDHLLVGPGGVVLVAATAWRGTFTIVDGQPTWSPGAGLRPDRKLGALVDRSIRWRAHLGCGRVDAVACFVGTTLLDPITVEPTDRFEHERVQCVALGALAGFVATRRAQLDSDAVHRFARRAGMLGPHRPGPPTGSPSERALGGRTMPRIRERSGPLGGVAGSL